MIYRLALIALWGAAQTLAQNGCLDPLDSNYDVTATSDDGTSCAQYCWDLPGEGERLVTDRMPRWITGEVDGMDLYLAIQVSQKYPITWLSLLSPMTVNDVSEPTRRFVSEFVGHGRVANTPGSSWTQSYALQQCWNDYQFSRDWLDVYLPTNMQDSSLIRRDFPGVSAFKGFVEVRSFEDIEDIRAVNLTRWHTSIMQFDILFYTTVAVTSGEVQVLDEYNVMYAIIEQTTIIVNPEANPPTTAADVVLFTTVQWPFELQDPRISVGESGLGATIQLLQDCDDPGVTLGAQAFDQGIPACNRRFHIDVSMTQGKCDFTATYAATFDVVCAASVNPQDCPLRGGETTSVSFNLESENVCPTIVEEVFSVATARTFKSARVGTSAYNPAELADAFMVMQRAYFEVNVNVIDQSDEIIEETTITSIDLCFDVSCLTPIPLFLRSSNTYYQPNVMLLIDDYPGSPNSPLPTISDFSLLLHPSVFPVPLDSSLSFHVRIGLEVTYYHTAGLLESQDAEQKQIGQKVEKRVKHIQTRLGSDQLHHSAPAHEGDEPQGRDPRDSILTKAARLMQEQQPAHFTAVATGQITQAEMPDANSKPPALDENGNLVGQSAAEAGANSSLRRTDPSGIYTRVLLSCILAIFMTALAL